MARSARGGFQVVRIIRLLNVVGKVLPDSFGVLTGGNHRDDMKENVP